MDTLNIIGGMLKYFILGYFLYISMKNSRNIIPTFLFLICAIPYNQNVINFFGLTFGIGQLSIALQEMLMIILIFRSIINIFTIKKKYTNREKMFLVSYFIINSMIFLAFLIGIKNNSINYVISDMRGLIFYLFTFTYIFINSDVNENRIAICKGMFIYCVVTIVIFIFRNNIFYEIYAKTQWVNANRIGFMNIIFFLYLICNSEKLKVNHKILYKTTFILCVVCSIIGKSVTLIILFFMAYIINISFSIKYTGFKRNIYLKLSIVVVIFTTIFSVSIYQINKQGIESVLNIEIFNKIIQYSNGNLNSMNSRKITNEVAIDEFKNNFNGYGLGKTFNTYLQNGDGAQTNALFIDNVFITMLNKFGILSTIIFIGTLIFICLYNIKYRKSKSNFSKVSYIACIIGTILTGLTTSHLIVSPSVIVFIQIISLEIISDNNSNNVGLLIMDKMTK